MGQEKPREQAEEVLQVSHRFLEIAYNHMELAPLLKECIAEIKGYTGCAAVGIRILDGQGNIPYKIYDGFSQSFYELESPLSINSDKCMCINVIKGDFDPKLPFYTKGGSFYMNGTTRFLATVSEDEKGETRNVCNQVGYESVALIPIRLKDRILGLIHVADLRENIVPLKKVEVLEKAGLQLGTAILRSRAEEKVRRSEASLAEAQRIAHLGSWERDLINDDVHWSDELFHIFALPRQDSRLAYKSILDCIHPEDRELVKKRVSEALQKGKRYDAEYRIVRPDGRERIVHSRGDVQFNGAGRPTRFVGTVQDITERKRAEEALKESEERYRTAIENSNDGVTIHKEGLHLFVNKKFLELFGYHSPEEVIGKHLILTVHPDDRDRVMEIIRKREKGEDVPSRDEFKGIRKDGEIIYIEVSATKITYLGEVAILAYFRDITKRKQAEVALRESEDRYRDLVDNSQYLICTHDLQGRFLSVNPAVADLLGYDRSTILNMDVRDILVPDVRDQFSSYLESILKEGVAQGLMSVQTATGEKRILEYNNTLRTEGVASPIIRAVIHDVTKRERAEKALRDSEEKYRILVETSPDAITLFDLNLKITMANRPALTLFAHEKQEDVIGKSIFDYLASDQQDRAKGDIEKVLETGSIGPAEYTLLRKDGTPFPAELKASLVLDRQKRAVAILCVSRDVTERKRMEQEKTVLQEQLRQSQKMEAIGQLAGGVAHDFNNLLTVIGGNCQLSLLDLKEEDPLRESFEEIRKATDRAAGLTRQLLAFSRRQVMEVRVLDLNTVLRNLEKMLHRIIGEDIQLVTLLAENLGSVKSDPGQIEQVIMNLAVNARDAMPQGGKLTFETSNTELDAAYVRVHRSMVPGRYVMLTVTDTGVGMPPEIKERIFDPFFTTKERGKGTGLGLSTVYGIVKQSGGYIWVYSEPGKGTAFKIYFPRVDEPPEELREKKVIGEMPRGNKTILVVEDEETVRMLAVQILERQGYEVLEAEGGEEALLLCQQETKPIHLVLTDVVMPGMSGRQLVEQLRQVCNDLKVIYMSGYTDETIVHHGALEKGINYVQKPFTLEGLASKVQEVLSK